MRSLRVDFGVLKISVTEEARFPHMLDNAKIGTPLVASSRVLEMICDVQHSRTPVQ